MYVLVGGEWKETKVKSVAGDKVTTTSGDTVAAKDVAGLSEVAHSGIPDMIKLDVLHSASILHNLKTRFFRDEIYTNVGSILISVNPFKRLPIYTQAFINKYSKASAMAIQEGSVPPHIFASAKNAYESMHREQKSQSIVISGESGAGKTEATKQVLQYLTTVSAGREEEGEITPIEKMIIDSSPILEAFGNAKTVRNNNSSRFGKYFDVEFNVRGEIIGGRITDYLLEKSRVVQLSANERNYHVFYQLAAGASEAEREKYHIKQAKDFKYLAESGCTSIPGVDDAAEYKDLIKAFFSCKITALEIDAIKRILSSVLYLGDVGFTAADDDSPVALADTAATDIIAELLQVPSDKLQHALIQRTMSSGGARRGSVYKINLKMPEALATKDALAKGMYVKLFRWLVQKITENMAATVPVAYTIGVLDIFGFEVMPINSFEQLCINFANEKLHQQFIDFIFKLEIEEYNKEQLGITVDYQDNEGCLKLIETKGVGILPMLHEQCQLGARGSDKLWRDNMNEKYGRKQQPFFVEEMRSRTEFSIRHYANNVKYETEGCVEKNKDQLHNDLIELMAQSQQPEILDILTSGPKAGRRGVLTVSNQFVASLSSLISVIKATSPHYIRCLKSTEEKKPGIFDGVNLNRQLGYSGIMETIKIRIAGYAVRFGFSSFVARFHMLVKGQACASDKEAVMKILEMCNISSSDKSQVAVGLHKIFLKSEATLLQLEAMREKLVLKYVIKIQCAWRCVLARRLLARLVIEEKKRIEEEARRKAEEAERKRKEAEELAKLKKAAEEATTKEAALVKQEEAEATAAAGGDPGAVPAPKALPSAANVELDSYDYVAPPRTMTLLPEPLCVLSADGGAEEEIPDEPVSFSGWLCKEGAKGMVMGRFNNWKKRYFVLKDGHIKYYADDKMVELKGSLDLSASSSISDIPVALRKNLPTNVGSNFFQFGTADRVMKVASPRPEDKAKWFENITTAVKQLKRATSGGEEAGGETRQCTVHLPDGTSGEVTLGTHQGAKDAFLKLARSINVKGMQFFSLVETVNVTDGLYLQRVLSERDNLTSMKPSNHLVFKKVIFVHYAEPPLDDEKLLNFVYCQSVVDATCFADPPESVAIKLAALQMKVKEVDIDPVKHVRGFLTGLLHEYLPYAVMRKNTPEMLLEWEAKILNKCHEIEASGKSTLDCRQEYVSIVQEFDIYGAAYYPVTLTNTEGADEDCILAVNARGLHLIRRRTREFVQSFPYEKIMKWGRSMATFNFVAHDESRWEFETEQGEEINKFMGIYVKFLLDSRQ